MLSPWLIMAGMPGFSAASALAANLDVPRLFNQAHWIVKAVMVLLAVMFAVGLYIIIYKWLYVRRATYESTRFTDSFWRSRDIEQIYKQAQALRNSPISQMFVAGYTELAKLASDEAMRGDREGNLANIERALRRAQLVETAPDPSGTGAAKPAAASLTTVGPHIAEALFATAIGLVAAIPAVMAYNYFTRRIRVLRSEMDTFEQDYLNIIKRHFLR